MSEYPVSTGAQKRKEQRRREDVNTSLRDFMNKKKADDEGGPSAVGGGR